MEFSSLITPLSVTNDVVARCFGPEAETHPDMLQSFIRPGLTQEEASSEALVQIVAGSDTSAGTIRTVMLNILTIPSTYRKLQLEIDQGIAAGVISMPIKDAEARQLPYLQAVIKEALCILPPTYAAFFREVPAGGDVIGDKFIPGGTQIGSSPLGIYRSKKLFGPDADVFRPERWTEASPTMFTEMAATVDLVVHYGKYQCLGKGVAMMEFNKVFVELLRNFDFSIACPEGPMKLTNAVRALSSFWYVSSRLITATIGILDHGSLLAAGRATVVAVYGFVAAQFFSGLLVLINASFAG